MRRRGHTHTHPSTRTAKAKEVAFDRVIDPRFRARTIRDIEISKYTRERRTEVLFEEGKREMGGDGEGGRWRGTVAREIRIQL